jgi:hypothetical protein
VSRVSFDPLGVPLTAPGAMALIALPSIRDPLYTHALPSGSDRENDSPAP